MKRGIKMTNGRNRGEVAQALADAHQRTEPTICRIVQIVGDEEISPNEPVKLLEVNPATFPAGIVPIAFASDPPRIPFPSVVVEVTEAEYESIRDGIMILPEGWRLGETLYPSAA